jgi:hypothetical protein
MTRLRTRRRRRGLRCTRSSRLLRTRDAARARGCMRAACRLLLLLISVNFFFFFFFFC